MELGESIIASPRLTANDRAEDDATQDAENMFPSSSFSDLTMPEDWWQLQIQSADAHEPYMLEEDFDMNNASDMFRFPAGCQPDAHATLGLEFFNCPIAAEASINPSLLQATNAEPQPLSEMTHFVTWPEVPQPCCQLIDFDPMEIETPTEVQTQLPRSPEQTQILLLRVQALQGGVQWLTWKTLYPMSDAQDLLVNLRIEAKGIASDCSPRITLDPFYGNVLCHLDEQKANYHLFDYSPTKQVIYIERPTSAQMGNQDREALDLPALDSFQMSRFAAERCPHHLISQLSDQDQRIISNAWKSAYWIKVLFDWNHHQIFLDQYSSLRREHPVNLQSLAIEFMYSVSYIAKRHMESLWRTVTGSLGKGPGADRSLWAISYALLITHSVTKKSKNSRLDARDLPHLSRFMSSLCSTTGPMLRALQQYRWEAARGCCWQDNPDQKLFDDLLETANAMTSDLAISFEHQPGFVAGCNQAEGFDSSFDNVFRKKPFLKEIDLLFAGGGDDRPKSVGPATPSEIMSFWLSDHGARGSEGVAADDTTEPDSLKVETGSQPTTARSHSKRKGAAIPVEDERPSKTPRYLGELTEGGTCRVEVGATVEVEDFGAWQDATLHGLDIRIPGATIVGSVGPVAAANLQVQDCTDWKSLGVGGTMWDDLRGIEL